MKSAIYLVASLILLTACAATGPDPRPYNFACDNGAVVTVRHPRHDMADLTFGGRHFTLDQAKAASGTRYVTGEGLAPGSGLVWWSKGDAATLFETRPGADPADPANASVLATCRLV